MFMVITENHLISVQKSRFGAITRSSRRTSLVRVCQKPSPGSELEGRLPGPDVQSNVPIWGEVQIMFSGPVTLAPSDIQRCRPSSRRSHCSAPEPGVRLSVGMGGSGMVGITTGGMTMGRRGGTLIGEGSGRLM